MHERVVDLWKRRTLARERSMDPRPLERLTRVLSDAVSRRTAVSLGVGGVLAALGVAETDARKKRKRCKRQCGPCKQCKVGTCKKRPNGTACGNGGTCRRGACVAASEPPPPPPSPPTCGTGGPCLVFVTSSTHTGNLGGLSGADAICQQRAQEANLPGTYMAWLSDDTNSPSTRFPTQSTRPYRLVDGTTIANNWTNLTDLLEPLAAPIDLTEAGEEVGLTLITWTHTLKTGAAGGEVNEHCLNWTLANIQVNGDVGFIPNDSGDWTADGHTACSNTAHLYCFQQS